ncbi:cytochrome P450 [Vitiosangium sp. GDMCC 1.1324]|uniref:cytochrome P450 n=1 Tax=Vitiosangium sp. (strain GDMCC 1.1324) TaxID=2138576 RepID=UPI000D356BA1|nr:cytochrome P450 [Vitiosangium sp. GDMCC 1.1324]PTL82998.1 cytochrome P450 [Vitiosangium sp. GDMCC 1.1324]
MASAARKHPLNPVDPENQLEPAPFYKELRENEPVHWSDAMHAWLLTRHDDVMNGLRDPRLSADRVQVMEHQFRFMGLSAESVGEILATFKQEMAVKDGAAHLRLRRQVSPGFSPQEIDTWRPAIRRILGSLLNEVQPQGGADLAAGVFYLLPPLVIAELLGIPSEDRERFMKWAEPVAQLTSPAAGMNMVDVARRANEGQRDINRYLTAIVEERRRAPGHDVISLMLQVPPEKGGMTTEEVVANTSLILSAGYLTTTDQLGNGLYELLIHRDQLELLRKNPGLLPSAVEEMLRFSPALPFIHRIAVESFELRGRTIRKGDVVFLGLAAANHDPAVFPDPDRFDITRGGHSQKHMSFGFGPHHCLGSILARAELEMAFEALIQRMPELHLDETRLPRIKCNGLLFRGFESLPVRW